MKPIIYSSELITRFADIDAYGHVNSAHYLDYVNTSRFLYFQEQFQVTGADLVKRGLGLFMVHVETDYRKGIAGIQRILVRSHVASVGGTSLDIAFAILHPETQKPYATGEMRVAIMDLTTMRPQPLPEWMFGYFFETASIKAALNS